MDFTQFQQPQPNQFYVGGGVVSQPTVQPNYGAYYNLAPGVVPQTMAPQVPGFVYNQRQQVKMTNPLTNIQERLKTSAGRAVNITQEDFDQAICTHRDERQLHLVSNHNPNDPDEYRCEICGAVFDLLEDVTPDQVVAAINDCINILETTKVKYVNIPPELAKQIFQIIAVLKQMSKVWVIASDQFEKFADPTYMLGTVGGNNLNTFAVYDQAMGAFGQPMPMMQPQMAAGQQVVVPQAAPVQAAPQAAYQQPMMQPQAQGGFGMVNIAPMVQQPLNQQAMMMTAQAPGLTTNGFGVTNAPVDVTPQAAAPAQPVAAPAAAPADAPVVTKQLQA